MLACDLPLTFPCGTLQNVTAYVTTLDSSCSVVLGHDWLARYNPSIDWTSSHITFGPPRELKTLSTREEEPLLVPPTTTDPPHPIPIKLVDAQSFLMASKLEGSQVFQLNVSS